MENISKEIQIEPEIITAYIELRVTPTSGAGFDKIAERICQHPQVKSLRLMSGGYDFALTVEGMGVKDIALFVSEKLSTISGIVSTSTHFELKKYKEDGVIFPTEGNDNREVITL